MKAEITMCAVCKHGTRRLPDGNGNRTLTTAGNCAPRSIENQAGSKSGLAVKHPYLVHGLGAMLLVYPREGAFCETAFCVVSKGI